MKLIITLIIALTMTSCQTSTKKETARQLKILQVAGGCCHEYEKQTKLLSEAFNKNFNCHVDTFVEGTSRTALHSKLQQKDWSKGYDVVLMSLCSGHVKDDKYILSIVAEAQKAQKGLVFLHCSLHNFRSTTAGTKAWRELMGLSSVGHEPAGDVLCENTKPEHPIMKGFPVDYVFPKEEVYKITQVHGNTQELARSFGVRSKKFHPVIWVQNYNNSKVFGTSIGHSTSTYKMKTYTDLVSRGLLWSANALKEDGSPKDFVKKPLK